MAIVKYDKDAQPNNSWIRYLKYRVLHKNQNNIIAIVGATGSGKTWAGLRISEDLSKETNSNFDVSHVVFTLKELMELINSNKLKRGSVIIFDEPQVSISNRDFQSKANKVFNFLLSTFRHRNYTLIFCTPYEDLLDKSTRKLFHAKFEMQSVDVQNKISTLKPFTSEYNSKNGKFYFKYLRVSYKDPSTGRRITKPLNYWKIPMPSLDLIKDYENKKSEFTSKLNKAIERELETYGTTGKGLNLEEKDNRKPLTEKQKRCRRSNLYNWKT